MATFPDVIRLLAKAESRDQQKHVIALLHHEFNKGGGGPEEALRLLNTLYKETSDPWLCGEIKRLQNRIRSRDILGRDLLRQRTPPKEEGLQEIWQDLHDLKSAFNTSSKTADFEAKYDVLEQVGDGGMSVVFKAMRMSDQQPVAIKYLREKHFQSPSIVTRFQQECEFCLSFDHPNIIKTFEAGEDKGRAFMVMEYLPLAGMDTLLGHPDFTHQHAFEVIKQTADALTYIHAKNIVHRDVKLSNLLISRWEPDATGLPGEQIGIVLTDFGLSKDLSSDGFTKIGTEMGTDFYAAPEQRLSPGDVDQRADIYSLGVCMYRLFSKSAFPEGDFKKLHELHPELPPELHSLVIKCLKVNREERLGSVTDLIDELKNIEL